MTKTSNPLLLILVLCGGCLAVGTASADGINPGVYLAVGDSITQGYDGDAWWSRGYPPYLADLLDINESQFVNRGYGGATAIEGLAWYRDDLLEVMPQYVLILYGTNDISNQIPAEETVAALKDMVDAARTVGSIPVLATVIPRGAHHEDSDNRRAVELNSLILDLAQSTEGCGWVDLFNLFLENPCDPEVCGTDDNNFYVDDTHYDLCCLFYDALHPSQEGYQLMAQGWYEGLMARGDQPPLPGDYDGPWVADSSPNAGESGVPPETDIFIRLEDLGSGVNSATLLLEVNSSAIPAGEYDLAGDPDSLEITYSPAIPFTVGSSVKVTISAEDLASPANWLDAETWWFQVSGGSGESHGDIDSSGRIDGLDLALLAHAFGSSSWEDRYLEAADLNGDGIVDGEDLARLAAYFGDTF